MLPDPKDKDFYEVVMEERKTEDAYLVTGNIKHFPEYRLEVTPRTSNNIYCYHHFGFHNLGSTFCSSILSKEALHIVYKASGIYCCIYETTLF